jgi:predicted mannosyl-3-phosphoglycerate phosphatase (HAD superfamily)
MKLAVSYFRLARGAANAEPIVPVDHVEALRTALIRHRLKLIETFVDVYGQHRTGMPQLAAALAACMERRATFVMPHLGRSERDPAFFEMLSEAGVDFMILDRPALTRDTLVKQGLIAYRADPRAFGERLGVLDEAEKAARNAGRKR